MITPDDRVLLATNWCRRQVLSVRPRGWHMASRDQRRSHPQGASLFDYRSVQTTTILSHAARSQHGSVLLFAKDGELPRSTVVERCLYPCPGICRDPAGDDSCDCADRNYFCSLRDGRDSVRVAARDHSAGLNCGRWDYIFSFIKKFRCHPKFTLPERGGVTMEQPFLRSYVDFC